MKTGKAAIGKVSFSGRENIVAVVPAGADSRGMMAYTLRYPNELRNAADYFRDIKEPAIDADSLELAETLIAKMSAKFDLSKFEDGYETAVKALVEAKVNNLPVPIDEAPKQRPSNVVNLMDALRKSIGADKGSGLGGLGKEAAKEREGSPSQRHWHREDPRQDRKAQIGLSFLGARLNCVPAAFITLIAIACSIAASLRRRLIPGGRRSSRCLDRRNKTLFEFPNQRGEIVDDLLPLRGIANRILPESVEPHRNSQRCLESRAVHHEDRSHRVAPRADIEV